MKTTGTVLSFAFWTYYCNFIKYVYILLKISLMIHEENTKEMNV
jgi:hypothetical protein